MTSNVLKSRKTEIKPKFNLLVGELRNTWTVGVSVTFIMVVYGRMIHMFSRLMMGSHCRSDELDRPDRPNSPTKLDQLLCTTFSRPLLDRTRLLHDFNPTTTPISTRSCRPLLDQLDFYSISTRPDRPGRTGIMKGRELEGGGDLVVASW